MITSFLKKFTVVIIAADSSGQINVNPDVWIVAVRKMNRQEHAGIYVNQKYQYEIKTRVTQNWVEKLNAILYFKAIKTLFRETDKVYIDKDFQGKRALYVKKYMETLFSILSQSSPAIEFITIKSSKEVKEAHLKTKKARYGQIRLTKNPTIFEELECLNKYSF